MDLMEAARTLGSMAIPVFVLTSMANVGLTQKPARIRQHLRNWHFFTRMLLSNLLIVPAIMFTLVMISELAEPYATVLIVYGLCAGAPFLIKLTATAERDLALGATTMMVLMLGTVIVLPILLPLVVPGIATDPLSLWKSLLMQMFAPIVVGMLIAQFLPRLNCLIQPWIARLSSVALYTMMIALTIGYAQALTEPQVWLAIGITLLACLLAFFTGFMMGDGRAQLKDVGGLGTAQRGTASALIVVQANSDDPLALVTLNLINLGALIALIVIAKMLSRGNSGAALVPAAADDPNTGGPRIARL